MNKRILILPIFLFLLLGVGKATTTTTTIPGTHYISDCSVLDQAGATYYLTQDIIDSSASTCMDITANNIILDCQGHTIDGTDTKWSYGIYVYRSSATTTNITIKNCIVTDWSDGIRIVNSNHNTLTNITANSDTTGIELIDSSYNYITKIIVNSNSNVGIGLTQSSNYNTLINISANNNAYAVVFDTESSYNNLKYIGGQKHSPIAIWNNAICNEISYVNGKCIAIASDFNTIKNVFISNHDYGVKIAGLNNTLTNITAIYNYNGFYMQYTGVGAIGHFNYISNSKFINNSNYDILIESNGFSNNYICNTTFDKVLDQGTNNIITSQPCPDVVILTPCPTTTTTTTTIPTTKCQYCDPHTEGIPYPLVGMCLILNAILCSPILLELVILFLVLLGIIYMLIKKKKE